MSSPMSPDTRGRETSGTPHPEEASAAIKYRPRHHTKSGDTKEFRSLQPVSEPREQQHDGITTASRHSSETANRIG